MNRPWRTLVLLLAAQALLAGAAATLEWTGSCGACRAGGMSLGLVGLAFYGALFIAALSTGPTPILYGAVLFGFGIHAVLVTQMLSAGAPCAICLAAAGISLLLAATTIACDRSNLARLAFVLPWAALAVLGWGNTGRIAAVAAASVTDTAAVRVVVFTQPDCPYCDELRDRVMPRAEREFGSRIEVVYRPAGDLPAVRRTPTIVVSSGRRDREARVIEGLPPYEKLRDAIAGVESKR